MRIYNECFYEMRKALDIQPYNFLNEYKQIIEKVKDIYLLIHQGEIIGLIACYGNEIDDLIVNKKFQHKGYGKQILLWGMLQSIDDPAYIKLGETELYYCICCQY
ncbi:MAG: GNAT family N-acetyltransferase [Lachnospiraceae bacterium]|nr:GNAT family N-acetyltransferase [Lachnospiraceae bacterium]